MAKAQTQLIVALDNAAPDEALGWVDELILAGVKWFKVGLELYTKAGPRFIETLKKKNVSLFLDLKLYDIPNTVLQSVKAAGDLGVDLLTVHCSGGPTMLEAAARGALGTPTRLLGVTVLTSISETDLTAISSSWGATTQPRKSDVTLQLAQLAAKSGLSGIVCSVPDLEQGFLSKISWNGGAPLIVTPGIRLSTDSVDDQKSVATPARASRAGSSHIVVGRPITSRPAGAKIQAAQLILQELEGGR